MATAAAVRPSGVIAADLRQRLNLCGLIVLACNAVIIVADSLTKPGLVMEMWIARGLQLGAIAVGMGLLRIVETRGALIGVGLAIFAILMATMAAAWTLRANPEGLHLLVVVAALATSALVPWGFWPQVACSGLALATVTLHALWNDGTIFLAPWSTTVALILALVASIAVARELDVQRRRVLARQRQRDRALAELGESERRFRGAFDNAPIGMALVAPDGRWLQVNRRVGEILGYTEAALLTTDFQSITHPDDLDADVTLVRETLDGRRSGYQMNKRYIHRDGRVIWALLAVSLVRRDDGTPQYFVSQIEDVTSRVEAERQLEVARDEALRASRAKSDFLATMSHELRTPLAAIIGMADILRESTLEDEQREFAETIHRSGLSLLRIINEILDLSRIEAGVVVIDAEPFDVRALVSECIDLFAADCRRKGLPLSHVVAAQVPERLHGDAGRLRQVLLNLLANAVKFTPSGSVSVAVDLADGSAERVRFEVRDTGIGIHPDDQARIFEAFAQADTSTKRHFGGSGLGLAICRKLVQLMGGDIELRSRPGEGTAVVFTVRLRPAHTEVAMAEPIAVAPEGGGGVGPAWLRPPRILVVEDNAANQEIIGHRLRRLGYEALVASGGRRALEMLDEQRFDAVLMDCAMPGMDGYETTAALRLRESAEALRLPVIALTADASSGARERCLAAGMDDYLAKPVRPDELDACLRRWIAPDGPR